MQDLNLGKALDRQAMARLSGGYTYTGSSTSNGSWSFVNQWTENGGFRQIGFIKYKVDKLHKRYQRTQDPGRSLRAVDGGDRLTPPHQQDPAAALPGRRGVFRRRK